MINMLRILTSIAIALFAIGTLSAQTSQVTFVHCSPDPTLTTVDIYIYQSSVLSKVEDVSYQNSSIFDQVAIYSGIDATFSIAPGNSSDVSQSIASKTFTPAEFAGYILVLSGVKTADGYAPNPNGKPITLSMVEREVPIFSGTPTQIGVLFAHASTDLETVDMYIRGTSAAVVTGSSYTDVTTALKAVTRDRVTIDLTKAGDKTKVLASFEADLEGYQSETVVFIVSGFKTPADNNQSPNNLVLLAVLESGAVIKNELLAGSQKARVQWINNVADPALAAFDVYVDGALAHNNFQFRKATAFQDFPAGAPISVAFAPATSTAVGDAFRTVSLPALRPGRSYHMIIAGVGDTSKFPHNPSGAELLMNVQVAENALEKSDVAGKTAVRCAHSAPDQASISIEGFETAYGANLIYGSITPAYVSTNPAADTFWVKIDSTGKRVKGYVGSLSGNDRATVCLASGFVDPAVNNNGPAFKLILVDANGNVNASLTEVEPDTTASTVEEDLVPASLWRIAPNPATDRFSLEIPLTTDLVQAHGMLLTATVYTDLGMFLGMYPMTANGLTATVTIPTSAIASGAYTVSVTTAGGVHVGSAQIRVTR